MNYFRWMMAALASGLGLAVIEARRRGLPPLQALDTALVALASGVLGARAGHVALNWGYFQDHLSRAFQWWRGGLHWQTGLVIGLAAAAIYTRRKHWPTLTILDTLAPGLAFGCALGWLACYVDNCAYGAPVWPGQSLWFLAMDLADTYGIQEPRIPVQLLGAGWAALVGLLLVVRWPPWAGARLALFVCLYSAGMFTLGFVRGDETITLGSLRLDQIIDAAFTVLSAAYLIFRRQAASKPSRGSL